MTTPHRLPQGAELMPGGGVRFRLWAPNCSHIAVETRDGMEPVRSVPLTAVGEGWHERLVPHARAGTRYQYILPDGMRVPDPASRFQPDDARGPSEVIDPAAYAWSDAAWLGRPWHEAVLYELHVGAFTPEGTFRAARERLDHLVTLGVTGIEIMPVADFPGRRNWGYDGVLPYAPDSSYGRPEDLMALVDAAHARGIMVLLDVVYNHFGPDGNYLPLYAPAFFTDRHQTPWGAGINFDGPQSKTVREFIIHNALYWFEEFHFDGLRLDAVHAILDDSPHDVLDELAQRVRAAVRRDVHLVLENEENQARRLVRGAGGRTPLYTAQWNDDVHHVLHVAATGEEAGYYAEYVGDTAKLGRALAEGFAYQGEMMSYRGRPRGEPSGALPPTAFVSFIQNHDQVGNRAFGDRLCTVASPQAMRALAAVYLLSPQVPMLFMGEEWHARQPFPFFCDFEGELADAVRKGRRQEFARFPEFRDEAARERIPDPQSDGTFASAKLDWSDLDGPEHRAWFDLYRQLLARRREAIVPLLPGIGAHAATYQVLGPSAVAVRWQFRRGVEQGVLTLAANLSDEPVSGLADEPGRILWQEGGSKGNPVAEPWSVRWSLDQGT
jgi:malto-oligosyltrehalose trehalohydrolase